MKAFFAKHKKKLIWLGVAVLVVGFFVARSRRTDTSAIQTDTVKKQDIKQTVLATGQVTSETDLSLSFKTSGVVGKVNVKVGDRVKAGSVLAALQANDVAAQLTQAKGALAQAQANYQKVLNGASNEEIAVSQVALDNAKINLETTKQQQQVAVDNAYKALLNSGLAAIAGTGNIGSVTATITGTYVGKEQGQYKISVIATGSGYIYQYSGLETGSGNVDVTPQPLGTKGLYIQFSSTSVPAGNTWTVSIPNTQAATYVANYNAYQAALQAQSAALSQAQAQVDAAQAALDLKRAKARPADLAAAEAAIITAQGQVQAAQAALDNTVITAPSDGTITSVDIKVGELATALKQAVVLQDVGNLHVEANISEANIASVKVGQEVNVTFDALGLDRKFSGKVEAIDPASTVVSGVVNYKVTVQVDKLEEIKPGMTANLTILSGEKTGVLAVPSRAVLAKNDGEKVVRVVTNPKTKAYKEVAVTTGMEADGGLVEITSGLAGGEEIVTYIKQ